MKVPLRGRGGKQDKLKESKSAFSLHSAVIYLNLLLPVWGSGMSQWSPTPLLYLEIIAWCSWRGCAPPKMDPIQGVISFGNMATAILYQRVSLSSKEKGKKKNTFKILFAGLFTCYVTAWCYRWIFWCFLFLLLLQCYFTTKLKDKQNIAQLQLCYYITVTTTFQCCG